MPFTLALEGQVTKGTNLGKTSLDPMLSASVFGLNQISADVYQFLSQTEDQVITLPSNLPATNVQFLRVSVDQPITIKINGSTVGIPINKHGDLVLVGTNVFELLVNNQSNNVANVSIILAG